MATGKGDRTLLGIVGAVVLLVLVAVVLVLTRGTPEPLAADSPEGVVQRYSAAVIGGDEAEALKYLPDEVADDCQRSPEQVPERIRVTLVSTTERTDSADVRVNVTSSYDGGPFGGGESSTPATFDLERESGAWRIVTAPWQLTICTGTKFSP
jgi:hypothetical protein